MRTVSFELAKQLKEAGYPQESNFYYQNDISPELYSYKGIVMNGDEIASPTADEILEQFAYCHKAEWLLISKDPTREKWVIDFKSKLVMFKGDSLADAVAKMWLYLKENNLL